jgi:Family of unknown function (DUF6326)
MLTFLLGDVLRIFAGDFTAGEIAGQKVAEGMWLLPAVIMLTPIVMVVLSLILPYPAIKWVCIVFPLPLILRTLDGRIRTTANGRTGDR